MKRIGFLGLLLIAAFSVVGMARAEYALSFSLPQNPWVGTLFNGLDGFEFTPKTDITVTALGWYDQGGNGLTHSHPVGIYLTSNQTLLISNTVTTASALDGGNNFRFEPITPMVLKAGTNYTLVGYGEGPTFDSYVGNPVGGVKIGASINFVRVRSAKSSKLEFPTTAGAVGVIQDIFSGPSFLISNRPPVVTLLMPSNRIEVTTCVARGFRLSASAQLGSYAITNVAFYANATNLIGNATNVPYQTTSVPLPHGDYSITAVATDSGGSSGTSIQSVSVGILWPTKLHELCADLAVNGDFVGCMCAYSGSNYVVQAITNLQAAADWQPYVTNTAVNSILSFTNSATNHILIPKRFFRAALLPLAP